MAFKNTFSIISVLSVSVIAFAAATPHPTDEFKNLQILPKNISAKELDKIMESYNEGLGVECSYCHSKNATTKDLEFEKDTQSEKLMARNMMLLTNDINKKYFPNTSGASAVTCYTCHHGHPMTASDSADYRVKSEL